MTEKSAGGVRKKRRRLSDSSVPFLFPAIILLIAVFIYPILEVFRYSFTNMKLGGASYSYTLRSYESMLTDSYFYAMLGRTVQFVAVCVFFQIALGLVIALSVDKGEALKMRGTVFVRTTALISMVIPGVVIGIIWKLMFDEGPTGLINHMLTTINMGPVAFLSNPNIALGSAMVANIWRGTAQSMILLYSGLKTIPTDIIEAARVDGASAPRRLINVILPSIYPVLMITTTLAVIGTFNTFDMIMALTAGGPGRSTEVMSLSVYNLIFKQQNVGRGSATAVLLVLINIFMAMVYLRLLTKQGES